jgi:hypothetical protein
MGLPQPLADAFRDFEPSEATDRNTQAPHIKDVLAIERNLEKLRNCSRTLFADIERKVAAGEPPENLDETIDSLLEAEEDFLREFKPYLESARQRRAGIDFHAGAEKSAARLLDRWIDAILGGLIVLRDLRWNLIALRADAEPSGDFPVFSDPQDLLKYIETTAG